LEIPDQIPKPFQEQQMKTRLNFAYCAFAFALFVCGCQKDSGAKDSPSAEKPTTQAPGPGLIPAATSAATPSGADANGMVAETTAKLAGAAWAIKQDEIKNDPKGQWAIAATASSTYNDAKGNDGWSANQATGAPNVDKYADDGKAWTSKTPDAGIEWLDLKYPRPVHAEEIRIRESCGSGAVIKVELFDDQGTSHTAWAGNDPTTDLNYLIVKVPKTGYKTDRVKITLATNVVPGWNEIDAVQLVGSD
jgi:hypothetical protein